MSNILHSVLGAKSLLEYISGLKQGEYTPVGPCAPDSPFSPWGFAIVKKERQNVKRGMYSRWSLRAWGLTVKLVR